MFGRESDIETGPSKDVNSGEETHGTSQSDTSQSTSDTQSELDNLASEVTSNNKD